VFALQFSTRYNNQGDFAKWFTVSNGGLNWFYQLPSPTYGTYTWWEGTDYLNLLTIDMRGINRTFSGTTKSLIWKWAGKAPTGADKDSRGGDSWDANYIFYRWADILLMKAEALNRSGDQVNAELILRSVRGRAGLDVTSPVAYSSVNDLEEKILDERARELAFEGKRWFDLVRIAKRQNNYLILADRIANAKTFLTYQSVWRAKLFNPLSWYMPINQDELDLNSNLTQNPFYITQ
jgi:hypothetical protein